MEKNNPDTYIPHSQPKALYILAFVEVWERFSYYGLRALLILYMCSELQYSDSHAYGIYGIYFSLVYASTVIGGYLADTYLGNRKAIYLGGIIILIGHICLALPIHNILTFGLGFIIVGTGFFKANITSLLGQYYHANDPRRDAGFTLFYMAINIGGFLAPIICGLIGKVYGWHYGFAMAGIGMLMSILVLHKSEEILKEAGNCPCEYFLNNSVYLGLSPYKLIIIFSLISVPVFSLCIQYYESMSNFLGYFGIIVFIWMIKISFQCKGEERKTMLTLMAMLPFYTAFFASFEQAGASMTLFTERHIDRVFFGLEVPAAWFQSLNPFFIVLLAPLFTILWPQLSRRGLEPLTPIKFSLALFQVGVSFWFLKIGVEEASTNGMASMIWLILAYLLQTTGELCLNPVGLSMVTKLAPARFASFMMGALFLSIAYAQLMAQYVARYFIAAKEINNITSILNTTASLTGFNDIFQFLIYFPCGAGVFLLLIYPFFKDIFMRHR